MNSLIQLSLFDNPDNRPLPLIVADKWKFVLDHRDVDSNPEHFIYRAQDWYFGLGGKRNTWSQHKADWFTASEPVMIEVKRPRRKPEMMEYVNAKGLYLIAQKMIPSEDRPQLKAIQDYLAEAGVFADWARRNPDEAAKQLQSYADKRYIAQLKARGYSDEDIPALLEARHEVIIARVEFQDTFYVVTDGKGNFGIVTNIEYEGLFGPGVNAKHLKDIFGTRTAREGLPPLAQDFCKLAERACIEQYRVHGRLSPDEAYELMRDIAEGLGISVKRIEERLGFNIITGERVLPF